MAHHKAALFAIGAALACSLALNVVLYTDGFGATQSAAPTATDTATETPGPPAVSGGALPSAAEAALRAQLDKCRKASWKVVSEAIKQGAAARSQPTAPSKKDEPADKSDSSFEQQQRALCEIAMAQARAHWQLEKPNLMAAMQQIGTEEWIEQDIAGRIAGHNNRFTLSGSDLERLQTGYEALLADHGPKMRTHVEDGDWGGLLEATQDFWREEDKLVGDLIGPERKARFRADELYSRSAIVAIIAVFAGTAWDESIAW